MSQSYVSNTEKKIELRMIICMSVKASVVLCLVFSKYTASYWNNETAYL
jgi:hypothetical protein